MTDSAIPAIEFYTNLQYKSLLLQAAPNSEDLMLNTGFSSSDFDQFDAVFGDAAFDTLVDFNQVYSGYEGSIFYQKHTDLEHEIGFWTTNTQTGSVVFVLDGSESSSFTEGLIDWHVGIKSWLLGNEEYWQLMDDLSLTTDDIQGHTHGVGAGGVKGAISATKWAVLELFVANFLASVNYAVSDEFANEVSGVIRSIEDGITDLQMNHFDEFGTLLSRDDAVAMIEIVGGNGTGAVATAVNNFYRGGLGDVSLISTEIPFGLTYTDNVTLYDFLAGAEEVGDVKQYTFGKELLLVHASPMFLAKLAFDERKAIYDFVNNPNLPYQYRQDDSLLGEFVLVGNYATGTHLVLAKDVSILRSGIDGEQVYVQQSVYFSANGGAVGNLPTFKLDRLTLADAGLEQPDKLNGVSIEAQVVYNQEIEERNRVLGLGQEYVPVFSYEFDPIAGTTTLVANQNASSAQRDLVLETARFLHPNVQCFAAGTLIDMADGTRREIQHIEVDDVVASFDSMGIPSKNRVDKVFVSATSEFLDLSNDTRCTPDHPFLTVGGAYEPIWEILQKGSAVIDAAGNEVFLTVKKVHGTGGEVKKAFGSNAPISDDLERVYNFSVEESHNYIADGMCVHNSSILDFRQDGEVLKKLVFGDGFQISYSTSKIGELITRKGEDWNANGHTDLITQTTAYITSDAVVVQTWDRTKQQIIGDDENSTRVGLGDLTIQLKNKYISGAEIGSIFGSQLGSYLADNAFEKVVFSAVLDTVFSDTLKGLEIYLEVDANDPVLKARRDLTFEESFDNAFENFDIRLAANFISVGVGQLSSFLSSEIIGGKGFAADLGRAVANAYVGDVLGDAAGYIVGDIFGFKDVAKLVSGAPAVKDIAGGGFLDTGFAKIGLNAIGSFLGGQLGNAIVAPPNTVEGQVVSSITSLLVSKALTSVVTNMISGTFLMSLGALIVPFIGFLIGTILGNLIGSIFNDEDYPRALAYLDVDADGRLYVSGNAVLDGMSYGDIEPMALAVVDSMNSLLDKMGPDAIVTLDGDLGVVEGRYATLGYMSVDGYHDVRKGYVANRADEAFDGDLGIQWNQSDNYDTNDFVSAVDYLVLSAFEFGNVTGVDALGWQVYFYTEWGTIDELAANLQIADDYRTYLENRDVIDTLISQEPDSAFGVGWALTIANVIALGLTNEYSAQYKLDVSEEGIESLRYADAHHLDDGDDVWEGTDFNDEFIGSKSGETFIGGAGHDIFNGRLGADTYIGGEGVDTATYRDAASNVRVSLVDGGLAGEAEGDTFDSIENLIGGNFADRLWGDDENNLIAGLYGDDRIYAGAGDDHVEGGAGADILDGGEGRDVAGYTTSAEGVYVRLGEADEVTIGQGGDAQGDTLLNFEDLIGSYFGDILVGNSADNILSGEGGMDFLEGGEGADILLGGNGLDFAVYRQSSEAVSVNLSTGEASGGEAEGDRFAGIENIIGSAFADTLIGDGAANILEGGAGADYIDGGDGLDSVSYSESLEGVQLDFVTNTFTGGDAEGDTLLNIENVIATNFDDIITVNNPDAIVLAGDGDDMIIAYGGNLRVDGGDGYDSATFENFDDAAYFSGFQQGEFAVSYGSDWAAQYQSLLDGVSLDIEDLDGQYVVELHSIEWMRATNFSDIIDFEDVGQYVLGGEGDDIFLGKDGDDHYLGEAGADKLYGGAGQDVLDGGQGDDLLVGQAGSDRYVFGVGYGADRILEDSEVAETDVLEFDASVRPEDLEIQIDGSNLIVSIRGTSDTMTILGWTDDTQSVEMLYFAGSGQTVDITNWSAEAFEIFFNGDANNFKWSGEIGVATVADADSSEIRADLFFGTADADTIVADGGDDVVFGLDGNDTLDGGVGDDTLSGGDGNDTLIGGAGNDTLIGGAGVTVFDGGEGVDTADFSELAQGINASLVTGSTAGDTFSGIENLVGTAFIDTLTGDAFDNILDGGAGADILDGGAGNDVLLGSDGGDSFDGGTGTDTVSYAHADAAVTVNLATAGSGGAATGDTYVSIESVVGSDYADILTGDGSVNVLAGGAGDDVLSAMAGDDVLIGGAGSDVLDGGAGVDVADYSGATQGVALDLLNGGMVVTPAGEDYAGSDAAGDSFIDIENVIGSAYDDYLLGDSQANTLDGGAGNDVLEGREGDDVLTGGAGHDTLVGGVGSDTLIGGEGRDTVSYANAAAAISVDLVLGGTVGEALGDVLTDVENVIGSDYDDVISGDIADNELFGGDGLDTLSGNEGDDALYGGGGDDTLSGGNDDDLLQGGLGADILDGGAGNDTASYEAAATSLTIDLADASNNTGEAVGDTFTSIENVRGSSFDDAIVGDSQDNRLYGLEGNDALSGGLGNDTLHGGEGSDDLQGGDGADSLYGNAGDDVLAGGAGDDTLYGGNGADHLLAGEGDDTLYGGEGGDVLEGGAGADELYGDAGDDTLSGNEGDDVLSGGSGNDSLAGGGGRDVLFGQDGDDVISGGDDNDSLFGGAGADTLQGGSGDDYLAAGADDDVVQGGAGADQLDGGEGFDFADYGSSSTGVSVDLLVGAGHYGDADGDVLISIEGILGSSYADALTGDDNDNALYGMDGIDSLIAAGGDDYLVGGGGADIINGGDGIDTASYLTSSYAVSVDLTVGEGAFGDAAGDILISIENLVGSDNYDLLVGNAEANELYGMGGDDLLIGNDGDDYLDGGNYADRLYGDGGADHLLGGLGNDELYGGDDNDTLEGGAQDDVLLGEAGDDALYGGAGNDLLDGGIGDDVLDGGAGDDLLMGIIGEDTYQFGYGDGSDTVLEGMEINGEFTVGASVDTLSFKEGVLLADTVASFDGDDLIFTLKDSGEAIRLVNWRLEDQRIENINFIESGETYDISTWADSTILDIFDGLANRDPEPVDDTFRRTVALNDGSFLGYDTYVSSYFSFTAYDLMANDSDPDGDLLQFVNISAPTTGALTTTGTLGEQYLATITSLETKLLTPDLSTYLVDIYSAQLETTKIKLAGTPQSQLNSAFYTYNSGLIYDQELGEFDLGTIFTYEVTDGLITKTVNVDLHLDIVTPEPSFGMGGFGDIGGGFGGGGFGGGGGKPIVLDLDGDGIELIHPDDGVAFFDIDGDGVADQTGWIASDDALLVYDKQQDGQVTELNEIAFIDYVEGATSDLEGLHFFDTNGDGILNADDAEFSKFAVWQDVDGDVVVDAGEMFTLEQAGIKAIELSSDNQLRFLNGNGSFGYGNVFWEDGSTTLFSDTYFSGATLYPYLNPIEGGVQIIGQNGVVIAELLTLDASEAGTFDAELDGWAGVFATPFDDVLYGNDHANLFYAGDGDDQLYGDGGFDTLYGEAGNDTLYGGSGDDYLTGNAGFDTLYGDDGNDILEGGDGDDFLSGGAGDDFLSGGAGNDILIGGAGTDTVDYSDKTADLVVDMSLMYADFGDGEIDTLIGIEGISTGSGNDILIGTDDDNVLISGAGDDFLEGGQGADELKGGDGIDTVSYATSQAGVTVDLGAGTGIGGDAEGDVLQAIENVNGSSFDDHLIGDLHDNNLAGGEGDDYLSGGEGADTLSGGSGSDTASYQNSVLGVEVDLSTGTGLYGDAAGDTLISIEQLHGSAQNDVFTGSDGDDVLYGYAGNDQIQAGDGDDVLRGGEGADVLAGGAGYDHLEYVDSDAAVTIDLSTGVGTGGHAEGDTFSGIEAVTGSAYADTLTGSVNVDYLAGDAGNDTISGGAGDDVLLGGAGDDALNGDDDDDTLTGGLGADDHNGGAGFDTADFEKASAGISIDLLLGVGTTGEAAGDTFTSIERIYATDYNDVIVGSASADYLYGNDGDDVLSGGDGNDLLIGGSGADVIDGGAGTDYVDYWGSDAAITVDLLNGTGIGGHAEGDTLSNVEVVSGWNYDDVFIGSNDDDKFYGREGDDTFYGGAGDDTLDGDLGDDIFVGGAGADEIRGGEGRDLVDYRSAVSAVVINLAAGTGLGGDAEGDVLTSIENVYGSAFNDTLTGGASSNALMGDAGDDTLIGGAGDDILTGGSGNDVLDGGLGHDVANFSGNYADYSITETVDGFSVEDLNLADGDDGTDTLTSIESLVFADGSFNGIVDGTLGDDVMVGTNDADYLFGLAGADLLQGADGDDTLVGGEGDDVLVGGQGADTLDGGLDTDTADYSASNVAIEIDLTLGTGLGGDAEGDTFTSIEKIVGSAYDDFVVGSDTAEHFVGGDGNDYLSGEAGNDVLEGGVGDDTLMGGAGDDTLLGGVGADILNGGEGIDQVDYASSNEGVVIDLEVQSGWQGDAANDVLVSIERVYGSDFDDELTGSNSAEQLFGNAGDDILSGAAGDDHLSGGAGDDHLLGGAGADTLIGGDDDDTLDGGAGADVLSGGSGFDTVDYEGSTAGIAVDLDLGVGTVGDAAGDTISGIERIYATDFDDVIIGSDGADYIYGNDGDDAISAGAGNDLLVGGAGADALDGGDGTDYVDYWGTDAAITVDLSTGLGSGGHAEGDTLSNIEVVSGWDFDDTFTGSAGAEEFNGRGGADIFYASGGDDQIDGGAGFDTVYYTGNFADYSVVETGFGYTVTDLNSADGDEGVDTLTSIERVVFADTEVLSNDIPVVLDGSLSVDEGAVISIDLATLATDGDGDVLTYAITSGPTAGSATLAGSVLTYNSVEDVLGLQSIAFSVDDGNGGVVSGDISIDVLFVNQVPVVSGASISVDEGLTVSIDLATLSSDGDGDALTYSITSDPTDGIASLVGSVLTYSSVIGLIGAQNIAYSVDDGNGGVASANLSIDVVDINHAPIAVDDTRTFFALGSDDFVTAESFFLNNDTDPDGDTLMVTGISNLIGTTFISLVDGFLTLDNQPVGTNISFDYTVSDGNGGEATASFTATVVEFSGGKPVVLDLDGDGIELVSADEGALFADLNGDGVVDQTGWVAPDDGLLAYDKDMDGEITDFDEISFVGYLEGARTDLEGLAAFDTNNDGVLDAADDEFGKFKVWQDLNGDGVSDAGELKTLSEWGIQSIGLTSDETIRLVEGNVSYGIGSYTNEDGSTGLLSDTGFTTAPLTAGDFGLDANAPSGDYFGGNSVVEELDLSLDDLAGLLLEETQNTFSAAADAGALSSSSAGVLDAVAGVLGDQLQVPTDLAAQVSDLSVASAALDAKLIGLISAMGSFGAKPSATMTGSSSEAAESVQAMLGVWNG